MTTRSWLVWGWVFGAGCTGGGDPKDTPTDDTETGGTGGTGDTGETTTDETGTGTSVHFDVVADATTICGSAADCLGGTALAVAADGVAVAAWVHDGDSTDAVVEFSTSDGSTHWSAPRTLGPAGDLWAIDQVDLSVDPVTGAWMACWSESPGTGQGAIHVATSTDRGATWADEEVAALGELQPAHVDCDALGGAMALAYSRTGQTGLVVRPADASSWTTVPVNAGFDLANGAVAVALRPADGLPFVAFFDEPPAPTSYDRSVYLWSPGAGGPVAVTSSGGRQSDAFEVDLRFDGPRSWLSVQLEVEGSDDSIWLMSSDDQATWSDEAPIHEDGGQEFGGAGVAGGMDLSVAGGRVSLGLQVVGATSGNPQCASPKLVDSTDGVTFDPCNLTDAAENMAGFGMQIGEDATGRRQALFLAADPYGALPPGVLHWIE